MADYTDAEQVKALSHVDAEMAEWIKNIPAPLLSLSWDDVTSMRAGVSGLASMVTTSEAQAQLETAIHVRMRDGYESEIKIHRAAPQHENVPVVVLIYGGGFICGENTLVLPVARAMSHACGVTVFAISYRLAPEHPFPTAANDAWDSLQWVAANAHNYGADPSKGFIVGGISAGGNLASVVVQESLSKQLSPPITGQWLSIPVVMHDSIVPEKYRHLYLAKDQNKDSPFLGRAACEAFYSCLKADYKSPLHSPINAPNGLGGTPASYIAVCGFDPLRDDGIVYAAMLREAGVKTKLDAYPGAPHIYSSSKMKCDELRGLAWLLGTEVSQETLDEAILQWPA